jgi:hypothetical protein
LISAIADAAAVPQTVETEGGAVTLLDLPGLRGRTNELQQEVDKANEEAKSLRALAEDLWVHVGRALITKQEPWSPSPQVTEMTRQAVELSGKAAADDSRLDAMHAKEHGGIGGLAGKLRTWSETRNLSKERADMESLLRTLFAQIARQSVSVTLPEIEEAREKAVAADAQALELEQRGASLGSAMAAANNELKRRTDAETEMGFDAPYLAAYLKVNGPNEVESPVILKRGERAALVVAATLARNRTRRQWVGGSQGFSFPIGHTGIRYRVGSFHGHPVESQVLGQLDTGKLVITNQRIAFIGQSKSTSIPFAKLLHIECYSDAVSIFVEGRESPDFYLIPQPKYALFMINWFLNQAAR